MEDGLRIQVLAWTRTVPLPPLSRYLPPAPPDRLGDHSPPDPNPVRPDIGWHGSAFGGARKEVLTEELQALLTIAESILTKETALELAEYVKAVGVSDYLFRGETDKPHRHRTWPNAVLRKHHAEGISPRTFRRTLATNWGDDLKSLMSQAGWSDAKTILTHYRRDVRERHLREFEKAVGTARDPEPDPELPGYG